MKNPRFRPGRPPKYGRAARAVTVTLPEDVLRRLGTIDLDLGRAIVTLVERNGSKNARLPGPVEISAYGKHAVIVVTPVQTLKRLPGVELVPLGNGRALISLSSARSVAQLELDVRDALEFEDMRSPDREALSEILDILKRARRSPGLSLQERTIIVLEPRRDAPRAKTPRAKRR